MFVSKGSTADTYDKLYLVEVPVVDVQTLIEILLRDYTIWNI